MLFSRYRKQLLLVFALLVSSGSLTADVPKNDLAYPVEAAELRQRRDKVLSALRTRYPDGAVLFLRAPEVRVYSRDITYPYRTDSDLYYLTGLHDPGVALLLSTTPHEPHGHQILFTFPAPTDDEVLWTGKRTTPAQAARISGIGPDSVVEFEHTASKLREVLGIRARPFVPYAGHPPIYSRGSSVALLYDPGRGFTPDDPPPAGYGFLLSALGSSAFHLELESSSDVIAPFRQVKSPAEIALIEKACDATCVALRRGARIARPGVYERDVAATIESTFRLQGASGWAFPSIIGSGPNACILHYQQYDRRLEEGDLVLMDVGAEHHLYAADVTRTIPVSGKFSPRQREIYDIVLNAQRQAMAVIKPGIAFKTIHETAKAAVARNLLRIGLIKSESDVRTYYPHGTNHGLGIDVHDSMPLHTLEAGMVLTVEPGIYIPEENIGIRIEDDVLVTEDGYRILSDGAPREAEEVERWMRSARF